MSHRQFRHMFMWDDGIISGGFFYHSKAHWLLQGQVLVKILFLHEKMIDCYCENDQNCEFSDANFLRDAAPLWDIMSKQNEVNISLQGKNK